MTDKPSKEVLKQDLLEILQANDLKNYTKRKARLELESRYGRLSPEMREFIKIETTKYVENIVSQVRKNMRVNSSPDGPPCTLRTKSLEVNSRHTSLDTSLDTGRPPVVAYGHTEIFDEPREDWEEETRGVSLLHPNARRNGQSRKIDEVKLLKTRDSLSAPEISSSRRMDKDTYYSYNAPRKRSHRDSERSRFSQRSSRRTAKHRSDKISNGHSSSNRRDRHQPEKLNRCSSTKYRSWSRTIVSRSPSEDMHSRNAWAERRVHSSQARTQDILTSTRRRQSFPGTDRKHQAQIKFEKGCRRSNIIENRKSDAQDSEVLVKALEAEPARLININVKRKLVTDKIRFDSFIKNEAIETVVPTQKPRTPIKFEYFKAAVEGKHLATCSRESKENIGFNVSPSQNTFWASHQSSASPNGKRGRKRMSGSSSKSTPRKLHKGGGKRRVRERETDPNRISQRIKQIDKGKNSRAYRSYREAVPKSSRRGQEEHPRTPNVLEKVSNRRWKGKCNKWRRLIHKWEKDNVQLDEGTENESEDLSDIELDFIDGPKKTVVKEEDLTSISSLKYSDESSREDEAKTSGNGSPVAPDFDLDLFEL